MRTNERVLGNEHVSNLRHPGQPSQLRWIRESVVTKVYLFKAEEPLDACERVESVRPQIQGRNGWKRIPNQGMQTVYHAIGQIQRS